MSGHRCCDVATPALRLNGCKVGKPPSLAAPPHARPGVCPSDPSESDGSDRAKVGSDYSTAVVGLTSTQPLVHSARSSRLHKPHHWRGSHQCRSRAAWLFTDSASAAAVSRHILQGLHLHSSAHGGRVASAAGTRAPASHRACTLDCTRECKALTAGVCKHGL